MKTLSLLAALALATLAVSSLEGQSPAPAAPATASTPAGTLAVAPAPAATDFSGMMRLLQEMHATNEATLKKQEATLETLDTLQKAAEELKIFSKRG